MIHLTAWVNGYIFKGDNSVKIIFVPFWKDICSEKKKKKKKNLLVLPQESICSPWEHKQIHFLE